MPILWFYHSGTPPPPGQKIFWGTKGGTFGHHGEHLSKVYRGGHLTASSPFPRLHTFPSRGFGQTSFGCGRSHQVNLFYRGPLWPLSG